MPAEHPETSWPQPFTSTKLDPPALPRGLVDRPDLLRRLIASDASLILVDAPAGWGKSSVLAAWSHAIDESRSFVFVRLGTEDNEPRAFWSYVVAAIYGADETVPTEVAEAVAAPGPDSLRTLVPSLSNSLNDSDRSIVLALDDYHQVTDSAIHQSVEYLIERAPRGFQVAIASRTDPPLPLARWRAAGSLEEFRLTDLQLSTSDTRELFANRFRLDIDHADAELLCERTEGWPAGIQLAGV
ncbi:MAG: AAA family ATPase [Actinomycetia bacterium]|nr:AAA family ATPase [Actinomycetes bacterium]